jgi:hypothetical protein
MLKSRPQSKQASICTTISVKYFTLFQHQSTYLKQLSEIKISKDQRSKHIKLQRTNKFRTKNKGEKQKLNAVLAKENTRRMIRMKTRVF